jgi:hypothetical protein
MRSWILISLVSLVVAASAAAQTKPNKKARDEAKKLFLEGKKLYEEGKYEEAIEKFHGANDLAPSPKVLFNIAQSYRLKGDKRNAKAYYEQYLGQESVGQIADEARSHIETLTRAITVEEEEARKKEELRLEEERKSAEAEKLRLEEERKRAADEERRRVEEDEARRRASEAERLGLEEERRRLEKERQARRERARPSTLQQVLRWGGLGVAVIGGVGLTYGVYKGTEARRLQSDLEDEVERNGFYPADIVERMRDGNRAESRALFGLIGGTIGVVGGGVLFYLGGRVEVEPAVQEGSVGALLRGSF